VALNASVRQVSWRNTVALMGCTVALLCGAGSRVQAQTVHIRPLADLSIPTRFSFSDGTIHVRQKIGMTFGARIIMTFNDRFDVVTAVTYSPGYAMLHGAGKRIDLSSGSHTLGTSTGARYWLRPPTRKLSWEMHTSVGLVFGGQPAYEDLFESSTMSGMLGTTLRYQVGRIVSLKLRVDQRLYRISFGPDLGSSKRPLRISFGLGLPFLEGLR
jgi:hypothetical protein